MKRWLYLCLIAALWAGFNCGREEDIQSDSAAEDLPTQEGWNSSIIVTKTGMKQAVIHYGHMIEYGKQRKVNLDGGVEVLFFDRDGKKTSHLTSERGEYNTETQDVVGLGHVVVISDTGRLETARLYWDNRSERIFSDTTVLFISQDDDSLWGKGFSSESSLRQMIIEEPQGVGSKGIDFEKTEKSFTEPAKKDTVSRKKVK